jgi:hypothetical protein
MASLCANVDLHYLYRLAVRRESDAVPDRQLLERFVTGRKEDAFAALVHRHGSMVSGVCRRRARRCRRAARAAGVPACPRSAGLRCRCPGVPLRRPVWAGHGASGVRCNPSWWCVPPRAGVGVGRSQEPIRWTPGTNAVAD